MRTPDDERFAMLQQLAVLDAEEAQAYLFAHPVLLEGDVQERLRPRAQRSPERPRLEQILGLLAKISAAYDAGQIPYVLGAGPVDAIAFRVRGGEITREEGRRLAARPEVTVSFGEAYIERMLAGSRKLLRNGDAELALLFIDLLWPGVGAWESPHAPGLRDSVGVELVHATAWALVDVADGRLYRRALEIGTAILEEARKSGNTRLIAAITRNLGILHLDPYTGNRSTADFDRAHRAWLQTTMQLPDAIPGSEELEMPEVKDALLRAEEYLREAVSITSGEHRGTNLKTLVQALVWRDHFGEAINRTEAIDFCREGLELLGDQFLKEKLFLKSVMRRFGEIAAVSENEWSVPSIDTLIAERGSTIAIDTILQVARMLPEKAAAFDLLVRASSLFEQSADDQNRDSRWDLMLQKISVFDPDLVSRMERHSFEEVAAAVAGHEASPREQALLLAAYAANTTTWDGEREGLLAVERAQQVIGGSDPELGRLFAYLKAVLHIGVGTNAYNAGSWAEAMSAYGASLDGMIELRLRPRVRELLERMHDLLPHAEESPDVIRELGRALLSAAVPASLLRDAAASELLRLLTRHSVAVAVRVGTPEVILIFLLQMAKGLTLNSILAGGYDREELITPRLDQLLDEIGRRREAEGEDPGQTGIVEAYLLSAWASDLEAEAGGTAGEQLTNLKRRFDRQLMEQLLSLARLRVAAVIAPDWLDRAMADDAVLLDFYVGASADGGVGVYAVRLTRGRPVRLHATFHQFPASRLVIGDAEQRVVIDPLALIVHEIRRAVQREPGPDVASGEALDLIRTNTPTFLGNLPLDLQDLYAAGKRVLYVVGHGALHYLPFHLLGVDRPLADDWTVISVPNIGLSYRGALPGRGSSAAVFGLGFTPATNRFGLAPLEAAITEATRIAGALGIAPILETGATKERVIEELGRCRFVHIASHGEMEPNAAAFQTVYLAPSEDSDGRLFAHEVLTLDLHHVELVTLSACETALGRFDADDNIRGLAANLFLAGVSNVIGTLWPAENHCTAHFFETLYGALRSGAPVIDAYRQAQTATREQFPQYRDWGAFYLMRSPVERPVSVDGSPEG